jgi:chromate transporter
VSFAEALRVWAWIGIMSFGGPAGQIATMHRELVEKRRWVDEARFLHALQYCMLLPGPEAQQLATYLGWMMHRTAGGLAAGTLFVLPGFVAILALSIAYATLGDVALVSGLFFGLKCAVVGIVLEALSRVGKRVLKSRTRVGIAALSFLAIFALGVPFPLVVLGAGVVGLVVGARAPRELAGGGHDADAKENEASLLDRMAARGELSHTAPSFARAARVLAVCLVAWALPFVLAWLLAPSGVYLAEATFFSQAAMVTFVGAYAVLSYVAQRAVHDFGWLGPREMVDGLGLAETTPGPLILVVEFVGFMGAYHAPAGLPPVVAGILGACTTVWVTFVPCFLWILVGAPWVEALRANARLQHALAAISAAVVGVIANLSIWFGLHVVFAEVPERDLGWLHVPVPVLASLDVAAASLTVAATAAIFTTRLGMMRVLGAAAVVGLVLRLSGLG